MRQASFGVCWQAKRRHRFEGLRETAEIAVASPFAKRENKGEGSIECRMIDTQKTTGDKATARLANSEIRRLCLFSLAAMHRTSWTSTSLFTTFQFAVNLFVSDNSG
jgi:hypothetical protein